MIKLMVRKDLENLNVRTSECLEHNSASGEKLLKILEEMNGLEIKLKCHPHEYKNRHREAACRVLGIKCRDI